MIWHFPSWHFYHIRTDQLFQKTLTSKTISKIRLDDCHEMVFLISFPNDPEIFEADKMFALLAQRGIK